MAGDIRGDDDLVLGHRFKRLERGHQVGQADVDPQINQHIDQRVVALDLAEMHQPGEHFVITQPEHADQQQAGVGLRVEDLRHRANRQIEAFVR